MIKRSQNLLLAVKKEEETNAFVETFSKYFYPDLLDQLDSDNKKKAFWINIYNAYFLILRKKLKMQKPLIYKDKIINIAGKMFSLDDIEHGILRRYRNKYSLGYLPKLFVPKEIKDLAVDLLDYRIHFALNCGAKSCPPIAFYNPEKIEFQLEMATGSFLNGDADIDQEKKEVHISRLFKWFRSDFSGSRGIKNILKKYLDEDVKGFKLKYKPYDWTEELDNFK